jgi:hypothetical protein
MTCWNTNAPTKSLSPRLALYWKPALLRKWTKPAAHAVAFTATAPPAAAKRCLGDKAVYVLNDAEIGLSGDEVVVNCAP